MIYITLATPCPINVSVRTFFGMATPREKWQLLPYIPKSGLIRYICFSLDISSF